MRLSWPVCADGRLRQFATPCLSCYLRMTVPSHHNASHIRLQKTRPRDLLCPLACAGLAPIRCSTVKAAVVWCNDGYLTVHCQCPCRWAACRHTSSVNCGLTSDRRMARERRFLKLNKKDEQTSEQQTRKRWVRSNCRIIHRGNELFLNVITAGGMNSNNIRDSFQWT